MSDRVSCAAVDELAAAYLFGAVGRDEEAAVTEHLASCREAHAELRDGLGGDLLAMGLEPVEPRPELRDRLMASVARTRQDHAAVREPVMDAPRRGMFEWLSAGWARGMAAAAVVAVIALGAWNIGLQGELSASRQVAQAIAGADAVHPVAGDAGRGLLLDTGSGAAFVAAEVDALPSDRIYEAWLIPSDGAPVAVGVFRPGDGPMLVQLDEPLDGFATFALTVERERVDAPTGAPVLAFSLPS
ncbi:MAG: anti-sigma factor [Chloroflexota bacterium]